jgi:hypothetical protein
MMYIGLSRTDDKTGETAIHMLQQIIDRIKSNDEEVKSAAFGFATEEFPNNYYEDTITVEITIIGERDEPR